MTDETRPFWADPPNTTEAFARPAKLTWQYRVEHIGNRIYDANCALWDLAPAIAAGMFLIWLINTFHR